jgi:hypothetical protein
MGGTEASNARSEMTPCKCDCCIAWRRRTHPSTARTSCRTPGWSRSWPSLSALGSATLPRSTSGRWECGVNAPDSRNAMAGDRRPDYHVRAALACGAEIPPLLRRPSLRRHHPTVAGQPASPDCLSKGGDHQGGTCKPYLLNLVFSPEISVAKQEGSTAGTLRSTGRR